MSIDKLARSLTTQLRQTVLTRVQQVSSLWYQYGNELRQIWRQFKRDIFGQGNGGNTDDDDDDDDNDEKKSNSKRQKRKGISPLKPVKIEDEGMGISI